MHELIMIIWMCIFKCMHTAGLAHRILCVSHSRQRTLTWHGKVAFQLVVHSCWRGATVWATCA